jgi:hypothetical protein
MYELYRYVLAPFFDVLRRHVSGELCVYFSQMRGKAAPVQAAGEASYTGSLRPYTVVA